MSIGSCTLIGVFAAFGMAAERPSARMLTLTENWSIQSSAKTGAGGEVISTLAFRPHDWYRTTVPTTVLSALVRWVNGNELEVLQASTTARIQVFPVGLEEMFMELFGHENRDADPLEAACSFHGYS